MPEDAAAVEHLHRLEVIRERAWMLLAAAERGQSDHFLPSPEAVNTVAMALAQAIRDEGRAGELPALAGGPVLANLWQALRQHQPAALEALGEALGATQSEPGASGNAIARAKSGADLVVLHRVIEPGGLPPDDEALAALVRFFAAGGCTAASPGAARLDAPGLRRALAGDSTLPLPEALGPLLADKARQERLEALATQLEQAPELFGVEGRFGNVLDPLLASTSRSVAVNADSPAVPGGNQLTAQTIVDMLAPVIDPITASTVRIGGRLTGDVWRHPLAWAEDRSRELVPLHALLLALILDLVEPLQEAGAPIVDLDQLPVPAGRALAEQILRLGLVRPRHAAVARLRHPPGSDIVVELRALSVALADRLADRLRAELGRNAQDLPVARILAPLAQLAANWRERPGPGIAITASSF